MCYKVSAKQISTYPSREYRTLGSDASINGFIKSQNRKRVKGSVIYFFSILARGGQEGAEASPSYKVRSWWVQLFSKEKKISDNFSQLCVWSLGQRVTFHLSQSRPWDSLQLRCSVTSTWDHGCVNHFQTLSSALKIATYIGRAISVSPETPHHRLNWFATLCLTHLFFATDGNCPGQNRSSYFTWSERSCEGYRHSGTAICIGTNGGSNPWSLPVYTSFSPGPKLDGKSSLGAGTVLKPPPGHDGDLSFLKNMPQYQKKGCCGGEERGGPDPKSQVRQLIWPLTGSVTLDSKLSLPYFHHL